MPHKAKPCPKRACRDCRRELHRLRDLERLYLMSLKRMTALSPRWKTMEDAAAMLRELAACVRDMKSIRDFLEE